MSPNFSWDLMRSRNWKLRKMLLLAAIFSLTWSNINCHGRIWEPPGRSTLWRLEEFQNLIPPPLENYDDDQLYCGGIGTMLTNDGKCGPCGDDWAKPKPRDNENGGLYGRGIIVRKYLAGQTIDIGVELTANHWGYFEFRLCPLQAMTPENDDCFDKYLLSLGDGSKKTRFKISSDKTGWFNTSVVLPSDVTGHAVLQWHYKAGNIWNFCDDDNSTSDGESRDNAIYGGATNCGSQEIFRGCSDIFIGSATVPVNNQVTNPTTNTPTPTTTTVKPSTGKRLIPTIPPMRPPKYSQQ